MLVNRDINALGIQGKTVPSVHGGAARSDPAPRRNYFAARSFFNHETFQPEATTDIHIHPHSLFPHYPPYLRALTHLL